MTNKDHELVEKIYADKAYRIATVVCCKCFHYGRKLVCRKCGHHICLSCKEPQ